MNTRSLAILSVICFSALNPQVKGAPGVTDDSIKVGMIADLSGPIAFYGRQLLDGMNLYLDHINKQGGVHGRKIVLLHEDDSYQPPRSVAAFRKLHDRDRVFCFAGNLGSSTVMATLPLIKRANVPLVAPANFNSRMYTPFQRNVFSVGPSYNIQSWMMVKHIMETSKGASKPRIAVIYQDDDMGHDGLEGLLEAIEAYDLELVDQESYKRGAIDFSSQVLSLKSKNPTHVILWTVYREAAAILRKAKQSGLESIFVGGSPVADTKVLDLAGEDAEDLLVVSPLDLWSKSPSAQVQAYKRMLKSEAADQEIYMTHVLGYIVGQVLVEALERAGRDLSREKLVKELETFRQFETAGPSFTFGPSIRGGTNDNAYILRALPKEGRFERVGDRITHDPRS